MTDLPLLLAGEIGKPHGIAGDVYVVRISDDPHRFDPGAELLHADGRSLIVERSRVHRDRFLVKFEGFDSREAAEALRGALYIPAERRRALEETEFWADDLVGLKVLLPSGEEVGVTREVLPGTAHDLLVVDTPAGERMIPMVRAIVSKVDLERSSIEVTPPEGLLE